MRLGISGWRLSGQPLGVARYTEYLLRYWSELLSTSDEATVFLCEHLDEGRARNLDRYKLEVVRPRLTNALWESLLLPRRTGDLDVLFSPSYTLPLRYKGRTVVAIHSADEAGKLFPEWRFFTHEQKHRLSAWKADRVIVNSQSVKDGVIECYGISPDKIDVVGLAADEHFKPIDDADLLRATREQYFGSDRPYILMVGGLSKRRNIPVLMEAFSILRKEEKIPHGLLLVGPNRANVPVQRLADRLSISDSVVHTVGKIADHRELVPVYNAADVFVLPSLTEGFSLTLIEAMSCGIPVITAKNSALGEVANGYGITLEQPTVEAVTEALRSVVCDPVARQAVAARCLERAQAYSWRKTADQTLSVIRRVAEA